METFEAGGSAYRVNTMDPKVQLLVVKRLMRFVPALAGSDAVLARLKAGEPVQAEDVLGTVAALGPLIAEIPDADLDLVMNACMDVTYQHGDGGRWYRVRDPNSGAVSNSANEALIRKLTIVGNVLRITFAPMLAEIAPNVAELAVDDGAAVA